MAEFKPHTPYDVEATLLKPTTKYVKGVPKKSFTADAEPFMCNFRSFGGTETQVNGLTVIEDTATVETWYDPRITAGCNIQIDGLDYEILGTPENINRRNKWLVFKVRAIKGGA